MIRLKLQNDLEGLKGINGDLSNTKKNMEFNLSQKDKEAAEREAELAKLREQLLNKGNEDGQLMSQFKDLQAQLEKEVENVSQLRELKEKISEQN